MDINKNKIIHALLTELGIMNFKAEMIAQITEGKKHRARDINNREANLLIKWLQEMKEEKVKRMRGKIIHYLCLYGMTDSAGNPDYNRINGFIKNIGSRNQRKKLLYNLSPEEMRAVLTQVESMVTKGITSQIKHKS